MKNNRPKDTQTKHNFIGEFMDDLFKISWEDDQIIRASQREILGAICEHGLINIMISTNHSTYIQSE